VNKRTKNNRLLGCFVSFIFLYIVVGLICITITNL